MTARRVSVASLVRLLGAWRAVSGAPAYGRLADAIRLLILDGRLALGVVLPGERELAEGLEVSRTTVTAAMARLRDAGFLERRPGAGARTRLPEGPGARGAVPPTSEDPDCLDLASAAPQAAPEIPQAFAAALEALPAHLSNHGYQSLGLPLFRAAIAARYTRRGLPTTPDQVMVANGAQHGLGLLLRTFCGPGDRVVIDQPTYPHAIDAIQRAAAIPAPVGLPEGDWDVDGVVAAIRQSGARMAYLIADFHNPTGRWMSQDARARLAHAAIQSGAILVFDETLADLWLDAPHDPYGFEDPGGAIVRLGSMGKSHWGGLRLGWIRARAELIQALGGRRSSLDLGTPLVEQLAGARLLADDGPLIQRRAHLRSQREHLKAELARRAPDWRPNSPAGGLSLWVELPAPISSALAATGERHGLRLAAGPRFGVGGVFERYLRLPYTLPRDALTEAVERLARAAQALGPTARLGASAWSEMV
jgi:DNA-binding transcriptional MocR family regulator